MPPWSLYFHTIRYLRPIQVLWRARRRLPDFGTMGGGPAPAQRVARQSLAEFPRKRSSMTAAVGFRFLNEAHRLGEDADWNHPRLSALWLYNLHYFDDLCAERAIERRDWHEALIARWIAENPAARGVGWDPYPLSLRIVNWIKWSLAGGALNDAALRSLAAQARRLVHRVEWHLLGNHLLANAKALMFAGCYFDGAEAQAWLREGVRVLEPQLDEQVLADGGHFERSPMYHAIALEDLLDLINVSRTSPGVVPAGLEGTLRSSAERMLRWAAAMTHPDGAIAFFNDAALGIAADYRELCAYAERLDVAVPDGEGGRFACLKESGYIRLAQGPLTAIFDVGPVGPDYLPGHAHADTLSFELSHAGQRVICNSGTSQYGRGETRQWERSTRAHNTVEIDGENSSEVWDGFRVARRAYPFDLGWSETPGGMRVSCAHDGYARLRGRPIHRRTLEMSETSMRWTDEFEGGGEHRFVGRIPLHPGVSSTRLAGSAWRLDLPSGEALLLSAGGVALEEEKGRYSPEFGLTLERTVLAWSVAGTPPASVSIELKPIVD